MNLLSHVCYHGNEQTHMEMELLFEHCIMLHHCLGFPPYLRTQPLAPPRSLQELLERQWEQTAKFILDQAGKQNNGEMRWLCEWYRLGCIEIKCLNLVDHFLEFVRYVAHII